MSEAFNQRQTNAFRVQHRLNRATAFQALNPQIRPGLTSRSPLLEQQTHSKSAPESRFQPQRSDRQPKRRQPVVALLDQGYADGQHGHEMQKVITSQNGKVPLYLGQGVGKGQWHKSAREVAKLANATGRNAVIVAPFDLTETYPDGTVKTRTQNTRAELKTLSLLKRHRALVIASAGSQAEQKTSWDQASRRFSNLMIVGGASGQSKAPESNSSRRVDLVAPTTHAGVNGSGTSVSTALVAATAAKVWAANPQLKPRQVERLLKQTATKLDPPGIRQTGFGQINPSAAMQRVAMLRSPQDLARLTPRANPNRLDWHQAGSLTGRQPLVWRSRNGARPSERPNAVFAIPLAIAAAPFVTAAVKATAATVAVGLTAYAADQAITAVRDRQEESSAPPRPAPRPEPPRRPFPPPLPTGGSSEDNSPSPAPAPAPRPAPPRPNPTPSPSPSPSPRPAPTPPPALRSSSPTPAPGTQPTGTPYVIRPGDNPSLIAQRELGDSNRWREIQQADGSGITEDEARRLPIGGQLYLPGPAASPSPAPSPAPAVSRPPGREYITQPGDTPSEIAERELGDHNRWGEIRQADGSPITDEEARRLPIGGQLYLPEPAPAPAPTPSPAPAPADSQSTIAVTPAPTSTPTEQPIPQPTPALPPALPLPQPSVPPVSATAAPVPSVPSRQQIEARLPSRPFKEEAARRKPPRKPTRFRVVEEENGNLLVQEINNHDKLRIVPKGALNNRGELTEETRDPERTNQMRVQLQQTKEHDFAIPIMNSARQGVTVSQVEAALDTLYENRSAIRWFPRKHHPILEKAVDRIREIAKSHYNKRPKGVYPGILRAGTAQWLRGDRPSTIDERGFLSDDGFYRVDLENSRGHNLRVR